jgi:ABC-type multidrug transport system fused ATPase/permease subunit
MSILYDVLFLYNDKEKAIVKEIADELDYSGYTTFYWERDIPGGTPVEKELELFSSVKTILVLLGNESWGPQHLPFTAQALSNHDKVIPVLIGDPSEEAMSALNDFFRKNRYADLRIRNERTYDQLIRFIGTPEAYKPSTRFDNIIYRITDGSNEDRFRAISQIRDSKTLNRSALSIRLREEIRNRFKYVVPDKNYIPARPPEQVSTIRSWMLSALIQNDPEDDENKGLLLQHLNPAEEPFETVRYRVLAGLYQKQVSYMREAVEQATTDDSSLMSLTALVMHTPDSQEVISRLRRDINATPQDDEIGRLLIVLRVLRVAPVPALTGDIVRFILEHQMDDLTYAAFYALANSTMAEQIGHHLSDEDWGNFLRKMLTLAQSSEPNAVHNFAMILSKGDPKLIDDLLNRFASDQQLKGMAARFSVLLDDIRLEPGTEGLFISGYNPDSIDVNKEWLDIAREAKILTAVMMAREVTPPLALGLFGNWGSGKSFFMEYMQKEVITLQLLHKDDPDGFFCTRSVQITFNAWHYSDTNLWASMVDVIFEKLQAHIAPPKTVNEQEERILKDIAAANREAELQQNNQSRAMAEIEATQQLLNEAEDTRKKQPVDYRELSGEDIYSLLNEEEQQQIEKAIGDMGIPEVIARASDLNAVLSEAVTIKGRINALFVSVVQSGNRNLIIFLLALILLVFPIAGWALHRYAGWEASLSTVGAFFAQLSTFLTGIFLAIRSGLGKVKQTLSAVENVKKRIDEKLAEKRQKESEIEIQLAERLREAGLALAAAELALDRAKQTKSRLEHELTSIDEAYSLNHFIRERSLSDDYRKHLGLISTVRRDFDSLTSLIKRVPRNKANFKPIDRIILYIDDLDRCPSQKIVEVLRAVHLMQAYELFIVVVGVDPRWLLRSIDNNFAVFEKEAPGKNSIIPDEQFATPQDFLEKIFQIPFCLRPVGKEGFGKLMDNLFRQQPAKPSNSNMGNEVTKEDRAEVNAPAEVIPIADTKAISVAEETPKPVGVSVALQIPAGEETVKPEAADFTITNESLLIKPWEAAFARRLYRLISSPRTAKRFTNLYRILKAFVPKEDLADFEGNESFPGDFQVPMILLALQAGSRHRVSGLLEEIYQLALKGRGLHDALLKLSAAEGDLGKGATKALAIEDWETITQSPDSLIRWLPLIARFSFEQANLVRREE